MKLFLLPWFCCLVASAAAASTTPAVPVPELPAALAAKVPARLLPADLRATMTLDANSRGERGPSANWSGEGAGQVLRVEVPDATQHPDAVLVRWPLGRDGRKGDVVLARFIARALYARQETGEAMIQLSVQNQKPQFARHVIVPLTAGPTWTTLEVAFTLDADATPSGTDVRLSFGGVAQAVEIAGLELLNFGSTATVGELPQTRFSYPGREPGAAWREAAWQRIEKIRTAPIEVRVIDAIGQPLPQAQVRVRLVRPRFSFGTAVDAALLVAESDDARIYREQLLRLFDGATVDNGLKWPSWSGSAEKRAEALRAIDWIRGHGLRLRGHTLVWPADRFSPARIARMPAPRTELALLIKEHIRDVVTATKGQVAAWDVINEMTHEREYFKYLPEREAVEWFKLARELDPGATLFLNEYGMLNSARSPRKIAEYIDLAHRLRAAGAPIDALGVQSHVGRQVRAPVDVLADLDLLAKAGLPIETTEFDLNSPDEELQADYLRDFLIALYSHPAMTGFTMWGFWEAKHWKPAAAMFRRDWSEKPSVKVWRDLVRGAWLTDERGTTGVDGQLTTRGHLGEYEFVVTTPEKRTVQRRTIGQAGVTAAVTIQVP